MKDFPYCSQFNHISWSASYLLSMHSQLFIPLMIGSMMYLLRVATQYYGRRNAGHCHFNQWTEREYEQIVNNFLSDISFKAPLARSKLDLQSLVEKRMASQGVSPIMMDRVKRCIKTGIKITTLTYSFLSPAAQEAIATYASYVISIDDLITELSKELETYTATLTLGRKHRHTLLQGLTNHLGDQCRIFGPFGGDMIVKGTIEFLSSAVIEARQTEGLFLPKDAGEYLNFFRAKTGVAEPFAFFCFPEDTYPETAYLDTYVKAVPSIMLFLGYVNDILSFYKEEASPTDSAGFIHSHSKLHTISLAQSLRQITRETVQVVHQLRNICSEDHLLSQHMDKFIQGYIWYHLSCSRYKLSELNISWAQLAIRPREE